MVTINWCKNQKNGIELIEPNNSLGEKYLLEAGDSLSVMLSISGKWKVVTAYYACYSALYALFMKAGIKCEIHDCSLELMNRFGFSITEIKFMKNLKKKRIETQYYLKNVSLDDEDQIKSFIIRCKLFFSNLNGDQISKIRSLVKND